MPTPLRSPITIKECDHLCHRGRYPQCDTLFGQTAKQWRNSNPNFEGNMREYANIAKLQAAGWDNDPHAIAEQRSITDGRIIAGEKCRIGDLGRIVALQEKRT